VTTAGLKQKNGSISWLQKFIRHSAFPSIVIFIVLLVINASIQPNFYSSRVLRSNLMTFTPFIFVAIAQGIIILSGSLDLSLGSAISLFNCLTAYLMTDKNVAPVLILGFGVTVVASGLINGYAIGKLRMPALITTFATSAIYLGLAMIILPVAGGYVPKAFYSLYKSSIGGFLPFAGIMLAAGIIIWFIFSKTGAYRYIYAIGSNEAGAYASDISVWKTRMTAHIFASLFIFMAGMCILMITSTGEYRTGQSYTLNSVAAVVIGGIALTGGKGSIVGAIFGALILGILNNIIFYSGVSSYFQIFAKGLIIVIALCIGAVPVLIKQRKKRKGGE